MTYTPTNLAKILLCLLLPLPSALAIDYVINNDTNTTFTQVNIADPTIRYNQGIVYPGENTLDIYEDYNFIIKLSNKKADSISIIVQPHNSPTCYPQPQRCSFNGNSVSIQ